MKKELKALSTKLLFVAIQELLVELSRRPPEDVELPPPVVKQPKVKVVKKKPPIAAPA
jgi:hypothetical protein